MAPKKVRHRKKGVSIELIETLLDEQMSIREKAEFFKDIKGFLVDMYPEHDRCPVHGIKLLVMKTDTRRVRSPEYPPFTARKIHKYCPLCRKNPTETASSVWKHSPTVPPLTRGKSPFSMKAVVQAGRMKFLDCRRRDDIQETLLEKHGVPASDGAITTMTKEFLVRLKCLHMLRFDMIKKDVEAGGGYILGIDGTGDGGSDRIFVGMDLLRDWVLVSARIPSESEENMKPHVEFIREKLGLPLAGVCDMSSGMMNVMTKVMTDVLLRICHYHFVDDVGSDLMRVDYMAARKLVIDTGLKPYLKGLQKTMYLELGKEDVDISKLARELRSGTIQQGLSVEACTRVQVYDTISWILRYPEDNNGMQFPYRLPFLNFYERCQEGLEVMTAIRRTAAKGRTSPKYLRELESRLQDRLEGQDEDARTLGSLNTDVRKAYGLFEELREKMRIPKDKGDIPRDKLIIRNNERIARMKRDLEEFREGLREKIADGKHPKEKIVLDHLDRYWPHIVLENVVVKVDGKDVLIEIPRTSSGNESIFGMMKSDIRKRLGKKDIGCELNRYGDYLCYVQNLKSESYVSRMIGSLDDLSKAFEELPPEMVKEEMELLNKRMTGYDVTKNGSRGRKVQLDDIKNGIEAVDKRVREVLDEEYLRPPELYGRQSNGNLTL